MMMVTVYQASHVLDTLFFKYIFIDLKEEGIGREKEKKNISDESESLIGCLLHTGHWRSSLQPGLRPDLELKHGLLVHRSVLSHCLASRAHVVETLDLSLCFVLLKRQVLFFITICRKKVSFPWRHNNC
uniref:Uncharacterized protein n=1 Tax=Myotis myotis TaxID=51298 RepID=A0A7J7ZXE7_MYOMY|nr:hypothetical protein mMyoMyo1_009857 [Myotis myotis]